MIWARLLACRSCCGPLPVEMSYLTDDHPDHQPPGFPCTRNPCMFRGACPAVHVPRCSEALYFASHKIPGRCLWQPTYCLVGERTAPAPPTGVRSSQLLGSGPAASVLICLWPGQGLRRTPLPSLPCTPGTRPPGAGPGPHPVSWPSMMLVGRTPPLLGSCRPVMAADLQFGGNKVRSGSVVPDECTT